MTASAPASPGQTPAVVLNNGVTMPMIGYGVFQTPPEETERCVREALEVGYRLIDTAQAYGNEEGVGAALASAIADGVVTRDEVFITTKIWVSHMNEDRAEASIDESLHRLGVDRIDLMLLHQAMGDYPGAYRAMERAYRDGRLRAIGVSNFYPDRLIDIASLTRVPPMVNQIETHPFRQAAEDHALMESLGIVHEAWAPFAEGRHGIFTHPVLTAIGEKHGKRPGQVGLRGLLQEGVVVIPKSARRERMAENLDILDYELDAEDMEAFRALDDGTSPRIFDHRDPAMIGWLVKERVRRADPTGAALY